MKKRIIESLLDTDYYKITMQNAVFNQFLQTDVEYTFKCRNKEIDLLPYREEIDIQINQLKWLKLKEDEFNYLSKIPYISKSYLDFLKNFKFDIDNISVNKCVPERGSVNQLEIKIKGNWFNTILYEVPVLAIVNEVYFSDKTPSIDEAKDRLMKKIDLIRNISDFSFSDFGTRRRRAFEWQDIVIKTLKKEVPNNFKGTSNVRLAIDNDLKPIGTMAHEWLQAGQQMPNIQLQHSQSYMLQKWSDVYRGSLGIALTDVIGIDAFLKDFDRYFAKLYDGVRHDSGDPFKFGEKIISHYKKLGIDPKTKSIVFSDGLTFEKAIELLNRFRGRINISFGIGTNLTNDFPNSDPLQIVIKMTRCNGSPTAKISDSNGKTMCDNTQFIAYLKRVFKNKPEIE
jgi:nicotinate phosphoribosyltransferase